MGSYVSALDNPVSPPTTMLTGHTARMSFSVRQPTPASRRRPVSWRAASPLPRPSSPPSRCPTFSTHPTPTSEARSATSTARSASPLWSPPSSSFQSSRAGLWRRLTSCSPCGFRCGSSRASRLRTRSRRLLHWHSRNTTGRRLRLWRRQRGLKYYQLYYGLSHYLTS